MAERLGSDALYLPNGVRSGTVPVASPGAVQGPVPGELTVVAVGRICPQKDPGFLIEVVSKCAELDLRVDWTWIGGGDSRAEMRLTDAGINVTGWLSREDAMRIVLESDVYLHCASWEGSPMSLLEAGAMGKTMLVRSIPAALSFGYPAGLTPADFARALLGLAHGTQPLQCSLALRALENNGIPSQREALLTAYTGELPATTSV